MTTQKELLAADIIAYREKRGWRDPSPVYYLGTQPSSSHQVRSKLEPIATDRLTRQERKIFLTKDQQDDVAAGWEISMRRGKMRMQFYA